MGQYKFIFWISLKNFFSKKSLFNVTTVLAILGMALGVASLVVAMSVVTSYTNTLKAVVVDTFGDVLVFNPAVKNDNVASTLKQIQSLGQEEIVHYVPFINLEAMVVRKGAVSGVLLQGLESSSLSKNSRLSSRILKGQLDLTPRVLPSAIIGHRLAKKFNLGVGDKIKAVIPNYRSRKNKRPKIVELKITGIISYGRFDYDSRYILTDLRTLQIASGLGSKVSGFRLKLKDSDLAQGFSDRINKNTETHRFWSMSWRNLNDNLFSAVDYEKAMLFLILLIIIVAAAFNISITLFVHVFKKYADVSIMKAVGAPNKLIEKMFVLQGLIVGTIGYILGALLGVSACFGFLKAQEKWSLLSSEVYKIENLSLSFNVLDFLAILIASLLICYLSTVLPARRSRVLSPAEGLRYE